MVMGIVTGLDIAVHVSDSDRHVKMKGKKLEQSMTCVDKPVVLLARQAKCDLTGEGWPVGRVRDCVAASGTGPGRPIL